ncbi:MAG: DUF835 domain-containing protein [Thermoplasmatota archaeon]
METATLVMLMAGIGLIAVMAWTLYRVQQHRSKMRKLDEAAVDIGRMAGMEKNERTSEPSAPTLPAKDLLVVLFRNKKRPWRGPVADRIKNGDRVLIITTRPPSEIGRMYPKGPVHVWLDRSTAHEVDDNTIVVNPTNLSSVLEEVRSHLSKRKGGGVAVFEAFEEVIAANEVDRVVRFLKMLRQSARENGISAVVPLPYKAVPQRVRNQLTEGFESVVID